MAIQLPTLIEWAKLKEWATNLKEGRKLRATVKTDVIALTSILETYYKLRRKQKTLAKELWDSAKQLEAKITKKLNQEIKL